MNDGVGRRRFLVAAAGAGTIAGCSSSEPGKSASDETSTAAASTAIERVSAALQYVDATNDGPK